MWPALNFAADSLENFSTSPPSAVNLKFSLPTAHCLLAAHGRRKREPSDTGLKGDTFRELTSTKALRPPFAELSGVAVGSKDRWSTVADQSPEGGGPAKLANLITFKATEDKQVVWSLAM